MLSAFSVILLAISTNARTVLDSKYHWKAGEWASCYVRDGCGEGTKERPVWCADSQTNKPSLQFLCRLSEEPERIKTCFVACRHHKDRLEWRVGEWSECRHVENEVEASSMGIMERNVSCILTNHDKTQEGLIVDEDNCLVGGSRPETVRDCSLPNKQECVLTEWTQWTECCDSTQHRTRSVLVAPTPGAQSCPQLSEWRSCEGEGEGCAKPKTGMRLRVEKWGECRADETSWLDAAESDNYYKHWPQVGTQHRIVTCLDSQGQTVDLSECINEKAETGTTVSLPMKERACIISQDCVVNEWSEWKTIQEGCIDPNGKEWPDVTERKREVLRLHEGQGQACPHLIETKSTTTNLPFCSQKYRWVTSKWSECTLPGVAGVVLCGGGLQFRNVTCVTSDGGQPLPPGACKNLPPPPTVPYLIQRCEVACPRDCEVSEWEPWGPCKPINDNCTTGGDQPRPIPRTGERERRRSIVVAPSSEGMGCPSLTEVQPCSRPRCFVWKPGSWSSCQLDNTHAKCGQGTRNRHVNCVTHSGEVVANSWCMDVMPVSEERCLLPCPYDCVVSAWSSWSPCSQPCSTPTSMALRSRNRTVIAPPGHGGHPCPDPDEMLQIEGCNLHGCHGYSWMTLPWQPCNGTCDREGYQIREVYCSENQQYVSPDKCKTLKKPAESRTCTVECPAECQVSPWSEWTACNPHTCYPNGSRGEVTKQTRYRVVLEGKDCGPLTEERQCFSYQESCPVYLWRQGNWSNCQLASGNRCGHGLRTRDLWCIEEGSPAHVELRFCIDRGGAMPPSVERCHVDCKSPCQITEWTQWTPCKQPCTGLKSRIRQLIGEAYMHEVCQDLPLMETQNCPCSEYYSVPVSEWSACLANDSKPCGTGTRYRAVGCYDDKEQMVDPSFCGDYGLQEEPCLEPCPIDCILSEWTPWSNCNAYCGPGIQNRTRIVLRESLHGGRTCGELMETKICFTRCEVFEWQAAGWSDCSLIPADRPSGCGTGDQYRQVKCMDARTQDQVPDSYCDWTLRPSDINACHVACPGDCVLSPWSEWSTCPKGCAGIHQQQRTRSLLRAATTSGASCPHSIQTQACVLNSTCFTYKWTMTNYSSCLPLGGSPCGEGMMVRSIYCLRSDHRPVDDSWCSDMQKPGPADHWCYKDCPVDCELAEWTEWNLTKCQCGQTGMSRHAIIATNPSPTGRPCPNLLQWKPCPATPCYSWVPSPWSPCQLHGGSCGHGLRTRNVTCVRGSDNTTVEGWHCGATHRLPTWELCYSPCDSDCQLSPWSKWSHCHADCDKQSSDCLDGDTMCAGYQTRSRAVIRLPQSAGAEPCPEALWETRPCDLGPCYTFDWALTTNGKVVCQRSDGLHVIGGCDGKKKPKTSACSWQDGQCMCEDGAIVLQQTACSDDVHAKLYYPSDELNVWMFAMIGIGCVFIIFVAASIYLLCNSGRDPTSMGYQATKQ